MPDSKSDSRIDPVMLTVVAALIAGLVAVLLSSLDNGTRYTVAAVIALALVFTAYRLGSKARGR